jgi:hypothetical protein
MMQPRRTNVSTRKISQANPMNQTPHVFMNVNGLARRLFSNLGTAVAAVAELTETNIMRQKKIWEWPSNE